MISFGVNLIDSYHNLLMRLINSDALNPLSSF